MTLKNDGQRKSPTQPLAATASLIANVCYCCAILKGNFTDTLWHDLHLLD